MRRLAPLLLLALAATGCTRSYAPELATDAYPQALHAPESVDVQLFRDDTKLTLVNATVTSYRDVRLWLNQRYVRSIPDLPAGALVTIDLHGFRDELGEAFVAGGFFRTDPTTPIVLAELQEGLDGPLVGLVMTGTRLSRTP